MIVTEKNGKIQGKKIDFGTLKLEDADLKNDVQEENRNGLLKNETDSDFTYAYPKLSERSPEDSKVYRLNVNAPYFGRNFSLQLYPVQNLISDDFVVLETFSNGSHILSANNKDLGCYFRGKNTALSLCNGVRGILHSNDDHYYVIHPLPNSFNSNKIVLENPHVLVRRNHIKDSQYYVNKDTDLGKDKGCSNCQFAPKKTKESITKSKYKRTGNRTKENLLDSKYLNANTGKLKRTKRNAFPAGATVFVETAVFVDRDLFDHMKKNFPHDTEREIIRFVLAMINAVQLLYHDPSLGRSVNFVLKRLEILKEEVSGLLRPPDIDRFLSNFCNWQRTKNPTGDAEPLHWDHALILTGLDLYVRGKHGKVSNQVVGLAPVAGMCTPTSSCTVNEGRHFESVYVVAHEIGHNLGMRHDGPLADNDCDPSTYIMSPTLGSGKITWSPCSKKYLQKFLDTSQSKCLLDHGSSAGQLDHGAEGALPGERFDSNQQCMLKYGKGSRHSSQQSLDDICRDLHCERERYTWTSHPALEGTFCGKGMWCRGGLCVSKSPVANTISSALKAAESLERVHGGWSQWRNGECASGCLYGDDGRLNSGSSGIMISDRICNNPRPEGNGDKCEGPSRKYQTCFDEHCQNVPRLTTKEFADQICTRAKDVDKDLTGSGTQKISLDPKEACVVWCHKRNGSIKNRGWAFPDGTACLTSKSKYYNGRSSYCIKGRCEEFGCASLEESIFSIMPQLCPFDKETNEITWRVGLKAREPLVRWKSASGCHYNCISPGSGVRLVTSKKLGRSSIQLCQPDQYVSKFGCSKVKTPFQHASMICSKYKDRVKRLSGLGMQISPSIEDPDRPCRVACQDENISHRFYLVNGEDGWFPFGTDCTKGSSTNKRAFCVSGKCLIFGSDSTPLSENEFNLPLSSRNKRSLENNGTRIVVKLNQQQLDEIVNDFNRTLTAHTYPKPFAIDLDNPIHINKDAEPNYEQDYNDYTNGVSINFKN